METQKTSATEIRLTQTVQKGGCAAKVAASELRKILSQVQFPKAHPELMVDGGLFDDAAIYRVSDDVAMVQTLDFFTPIVDSPRLFGQIAAANSLSDVYAMGGRPKTAMAILAFPLATMESEVIVQVLQGASDKVAESNANFVGGHSIDDDTLKFGLSVTGFVHPSQVWSNAGAMPGDVLILTKALGTGGLTAGLKRGAWNESDIQEALDSMAQLNNAIDYLSPEDIPYIHSATDITGFGIAGHAMQMAKASRVNFEIYLSKIPRFQRFAEAMQSGFLTKAHRSNRDYTREFVKFTNPNTVDENLVFDPQTSGGLLLSVAPERAEKILEKIRSQFSKAAMIGQVKNFQETGHPGNLIFHEI